MEVLISTIRYYAGFIIVYIFLIVFNYICDRVLFSDYISTILYIIMKGWMV